MRHILSFILFCYTHIVCAQALDKNAIHIKGNLEPFTHELKIETLSDGIQLMTLHMDSDKPVEPSPFHVEWEFPAVDICGQWKTHSHTPKFLYPNWSSSARITSRAASNAPVFSLYNLNDENRLTFACSDALNKIILKAGLQEENGQFQCKVEFFTEPHPAIQSYDVQIRIDTRKVPFWRSLADVASWWEGMDCYKPAFVPEHARLPMYSSWYTFHQNLVVEDVLQECRLAKNLGYEAIIIDDGWQTTDSNRGYSFTGDWKPERIPQMRAFVDSVHQIGMKFLLWYSLPYIGDKSKNFEKFKDQFLHYWGGEWGGSYTLDPRYPEVREFLINTFEKALKEWDLDGFKLDFIDAFGPTDDTQFTKEDGRDFASINKAVDRLMTDIMDRLRQIKPDVLIEFRQSYIGPLMRKYGNMFRAGDCPDSYLYNRIRTTDLRLLSGNTAVHSDMLMWHSDEPVESAALQILNILFSVPQLSVRLANIPESHNKMIQFWTNYWRENHSILLDGKFEPRKPGLNYPLLQSSTSEKTIVGLYDDRIVECEQLPMDVINGKKTEQVVLNCHEGFGNVRICTFDCLGNLFNEETIKLKKGVNALLIPPSGLLSIKKVQ